MTNLRIMNGVKILLGCCIMAMIGTSCTHKSNETLIGGEKDSHGCLVAAGYSWSAIKNDCIRVFDDGVQLTNSQDKDATSAAYLVFSADSSKIELFLPTGGENEKNPILRREGKDAVSWSSKSKSMDAYRVLEEGDSWVLYKGQTEIYRSE